MSKIEGKVTRIQKVEANEGQSGWIYEINHGVELGSWANGEVTLLEYRGKLVTLSPEDQTVVYSLLRQILESNGTIDFTGNMKPAPEPELWNGDWDYTVLKEAAQLAEHMFNESCAPRNGMSQYERSKACRVSNMMNDRLRKAYEA